MNGEAPPQIGPYRVLAQLGRGGMGVVYRAAHVASGELVALKTVLVAQAGQLAGIRREIHALARIRHPGIVRIVAEGLHEGLPWYAMELLTGQTLRRHGALASGPKASPKGEAHAATEEFREATTPVAASWTEALAPTLGFERPPESPLQRRTGPDPAATVPVVTPARAGPRYQNDPARLRELLTLVRRLCAPLGYLHGEGIVHRDLKPDNVLVREDGAPVLMDFGLMSRFGGGLSRDALEVTGDLVGTVAYMAPEQGRGELVDARADIYSLGCILYELVTGRPPFLAENPFDVLLQHATSQLPRPSELADGVPDELDALVMRLLSKSPHARPSYAGDVAAALVPLGADPRDDPAAPRPRPYLYRPSLMGRAASVEALSAPLDATGVGRGGLVIVEGEAGVGKTRFAMEVAQAASQRNMALQAGECAPPERDEASPPGEATAPAPLGALRRLLQTLGDRCREHGIAVTERLFGRRAKVLALYEPSLSDLPGQGIYPEPAPLPAAAARVRLFSYLAETAAAAAGLRPLLLVLDDLHWADDLTLGFLEFLVFTEQLERLPLVIVATSRSEEQGARIAALAAHPSTILVRLPRLSSTSVAEMVDDMLGHARAPELFRSFLAQNTEGNPFLVTEYLGAAVQEGILYRDASGDWQVEVDPGTPPERAYEELRLPRSVRDLVRRRLDALPEPTRRLLEVAAVLGREVEEPLLAQVAGLDAAEVLDALDAARSSRVLEDAGGEALRFAHTKLREVTLEGLEPERRRELHLRAAGALESRGIGDERAAELAEHWERAGDAARARDRYETASRWALGRYLLADAARAYRRLLALTPVPTPASVTARHDLADKVLGIAGRHHEAIAELELALAEARGLGHRPLQVQALRGLAMALHRTGESSAAFERFADALALAREEGDRRLEGSVLSRIGACHRELGRIAEAEETLQEALAMAKEAADRALELPILVNLASTLGLGGHAARARDLYEAALPLARSLDDRRIEGVTLANLSVLELNRGALAEAERFAQLAVDVHRETGNRAAEAIAIDNLAQCRHLQGDVDAARRMYEECISIARTVDPGAEATARMHLANLELEDGRIPEARALADRALEIYRRYHDRRFEAATLMVLGTIERLGMGHAEAALPLLEECARVMEELGDRSELAKCLCHIAHATLAAGRPGAQAVRDRARAMADELGILAESELGTLLSRLDRALLLQESGGRLLRGDVPEEIPARLRRAIEQAAGPT